MQNLNKKRRRFNRDLVISYLARMAESKNHHSILPGIMLQLSWTVMEDGPKEFTLNVTSGHERGVEVVRKIVESAAKAHLSLSVCMLLVLRTGHVPKKKF